MGEIRRAEERDESQVVILFGDSGDAVQHDLLIWKDLESSEVQFQLRAHETGGGGRRVVRDVASLTLPATEVEKLADLLVSFAQ